jgi:hypothetical protein
MFFVGGLDVTEQNVKHAGDWWQSRRQKRLRKIVGQGSRQRRFVQQRFNFEKPDNALVATAGDDAACTADG